MPAILTPAAIAAAAAAELPRIFDDALDTLREGEAQYLRDGNPQSLPGKISQAAGRSACRIYSTGSVNLNPAAAEKYERACRPYLDNIYPPSPPAIGQPIRGGQCAGLFYNVTYLSEDRASFGTNCTPFANPITRNDLIGGTMPVLGPIGPIAESLVPRPNNSPNGDQSFSIMTGSGPRSLNLGGSVTQSYAIACGPSYRISNFVAVRSNGAADTCGNPPPVVRQPRENPDPTPPPFRFNPDPFIDIDVDVDVDVDGRITVNVGTGPITVDPFGGGGGGGDSGGGGNDPVGGPGTSGGSGDTGAGGTEEGSADAGEELVGVLVQVLSAPEGANRFFNNSELVYRGAYYVAMGYPGRLGLDMSGGTAETLQFFHAQQRGLTDYRVRANVGFNLRVTPYYRNLEP